ncbi:methyltransferase domain-containing protein [Candidatus Uabimicrobium sp. HlEnr_7]|uniref:methyltransferase domain-containing protein n=1 Tax=Candidatus Uabimicrobium helgolandensis TaxID=3095367 RepID=UPI0035568B7C
MESLSTRTNTKEQLDNLNLDGIKLHEILQELEFINKYFGNTRSIIKAITNLATPNIKIVDLGCGGGDIARAVAKHLCGRGVDFHYLGIDGNPATINYAQQKSIKYPQIEFVVNDIFEDSFRVPQCDILLSSHFMYHFSNKQLIDFINKHSHKVQQAIIFSELKRSRTAYILFQIGTRILNLSKITREDGLLALRRAFSKKELQRIAEQCKSNKYFNLQNKWAFRQLLTIYR